MSPLLDDRPSDSKAKSLNRRHGGWRVSGVGSQESSPRSWDSRGRWAQESRLEKSVGLRSQVPGVGTRKVGGSQESGLERSAGLKSRVPGVGTREVDGSQESGLKSHRTQEGEGLENRRT